MKTAVLVTSFNRVATTLRGLGALFEAAQAQSLTTLDVFLVDDASPDNTGSIVKEHFPQVRVIAGTGQLYWNRGMCRAYETARRAGTYDAYLLFNDDATLMPDALERLLSGYLELNRTAPSVIVGAMCSRVTGETTYAGFSIAAKFRPSTFNPVYPDGTLRECDTFNGNCVLVPASLMHEVGGPDPAYHHSYGDIDLGLVLRKRGCKSYLLPEHAGYCEPNNGSRKSDFLKRIRALYSPPHPVSDQVHFTYKRYSWPLATVIAVAQVFKRITSAIVPQKG